MSDTFGLSFIEPFAHYDPESSSWRTWQLLLDGQSLASYSETWPKQGTMRNGRVYEHQTWEHPIDENGSSLLPTPTATVIDKDAEVYMQKRNETGRTTPGALEMAVKLLPTPTARDYKGVNGRHDNLVHVFNGESTSQPSDDGNELQDQLQGQPTTEEGLNLDLWNG